MSFILNCYGKLAINWHNSFSVLDTILLYLALFYYLLVYLKKTLNTPFAYDIILACFRFPRECLLIFFSVVSMLFNTELK